MKDYGVPRVRCAVNSTLREPIVGVVEGSDEIVDEVWFERKSKFGGRC